MVHECMRLNKEKGEPSTLTDIMSEMLDLVSNKEEEESLKKGDL